MASKNTNRHDNRDDDVDNDFDDDTRHGRSQRHTGRRVAAVIVAGAFLVAAVASGGIPGLEQVAQSWVSSSQSDSSASVSTDPSDDALASAAASVLASENGQTSQDQTTQDASSAIAAATSDAPADAGSSATASDISFCTVGGLDQHYDKHGREMGYASPEDYEQAAAQVVEAPDTMHKPESEDDDTVYYQQSGNNFVVVSDRGCIRTYFRPDDGIAYYNRQ